MVDVVRDVADAHDAPTSAVALAWLIHQPTVTAPLASATTPDQLAELVAAEALDLSTRGNGGSHGGIRDVRLASRSATDLLESGMA